MASSVPKFDRFIDPLLRLLATKTDGVRTLDAYEALANTFSLDDAAREERLASSGQKLYQNRISWAHFYLKRSALSSSPQRGTWKITDYGRQFAEKNKATITLAALDSAVAGVATDLPDNTLRISDLIDPKKQLVWVSRDAPITEAIAKMTFYDYSQLPVLQNERSVIGIISCKSTVRRFARGDRPESVRDCLEPEMPVVVTPDRALLDVAGDILERDAVLVKAADNRIISIVTPYDIAQEFRSSSEQFLLLGTIENHVRRIVSRYPRDLVAAAFEGGNLERKFESIYDLGFGDYQTIIQNEVNWRFAKLPVDRNFFIAQLDRMRQIRNAVMHFDPELGEEATLELRNFIRLLRDIAPIT